MLHADDFFNLEACPYRALFAGTEYVWEGLQRIGALLDELLEPNVAALRRGRSAVEETVILHEGRVIRSGFEIENGGKRTLVKLEGSLLEGASIVYAGAHLLDDNIYLGRDTVVEPCALIKGPARFGDRTEIRHGAYVRGEVLVGNDCVVGHTTEIKSSVMLGGSKAGHFAYIGDSILGRVNLGAGTKLANLKITGSPVVVNCGGVIYQTGLRKFGAILADGVETGCNSVTAPGTLLGKEVLLYANAAARGYYEPRSMIKVNQEQVRFPLQREEL